jgi:hypothetical protein
MKLFFVFLLVLPVIQAHVDEEILLDYSSIELLEQTYKNGFISSDECHIQAHELGRKATQELGLVHALAQQVHICRSGFIHGAVEEYDFENNSDITYICTAGSQALQEQCIHGIGHGLTQELGKQHAITMCETFTKYDASICIS